MKSPLNRGGLRFYLVLLALLVGTFWLNSTTPRSILAGMPLLLLGVSLHTWAKGCLRQNRLVATIGPYRFVRHPFYLANALIDAGLVAMSGCWPLAIVLPLWWLAIYIPVIRGEERFLSEKFPDEYPPYRRRVPCLIPWRRPLAYAGDGFRWNNPNIAGGEELSRAVRILAYPLLFLVAAGLRNSRLDWFRDGWHLTAALGLVSLYTFAANLQRHQRRRAFILPHVLEHPIFRAIIAACVLAAVMGIDSPRTTFHLLPLFGALLLLLSIGVYSRFPGFSSGSMRAILAELIALLGMIMSGELLWLAPLVIVIYAAWILDQLLADSASHDAAPDRRPLPYWPWLYPLLATVCSAVIGIKLVGSVFSNFLGRF